MSIGVTVRTGVRELQVLAALLAHRFKEQTGAQPDAALLRKLTLELYLRPRPAPNVSDASLPLARARPALDGRRRAGSKHAWKDG